MSKLGIGGRRPIMPMIGLVMLWGCTAVTPWPPTPGPSATRPASQATALPSLVSLPLTPTLLPDTSWQMVQPGLERRVIRLMAADGQVQEEVSIFRLEPALYDFGIAYHPGQPQTLREWQAETGALLVVNGGFFTETFVATGRTVVAGQASGTSYDHFAGMFAVTHAGPEVRWLGARPYDPDEPLLYALQSFPVLVKPGGYLGYPVEDGDKNRRTVVGQDADGRILFIIAPWGSFTLHELGVWLTQSDLNLDVALNLDGGTSTGLLVAAPEYTIPAFTRLPIVITVSAK